MHDVWKVQLSHFGIFDLLDDLIKSLWKLAATMGWAKATYSEDGPRHCAPRGFD